MTTAATIYLPEAASILDVADVLAISCGLKISEHLRPGEGVSVGGVRLSSFIDLAPNIVFVDLHGELVDGHSWRRFIYNFESDGRFRRSIQISSTPLDLALGARIVGIFGGELVCRDEAGGCTIVAVSSASKLNLETVKRGMLPLGDDEIDAQAVHAVHPREVHPRVSDDQVQREFDDIEQSRINMLLTRRELNLDNIQRERERCIRNASSL